MSVYKESAAPGIHRNDGPPRLNSSRCGTDYTPAKSLNQSSSGMPPAITKKSGEKMNQELALRPKQNHVVIQDSHFSARQKEIIKNSICKGVSDEEFEIFLMACVKTQLDPFMHQIYAVKRKSKQADGQWRESMTIQTGIDGYRLIAERSERYAPGPEPTYVHDENGRLLSSTAYIKKQTADGTWHIVSASAYLEEYCQTFLDKNTGEKRPTGMWATMPRTMLAKCAEAQALRKSFPAEMSGVYTKEEMQQADIEDIAPPVSLERTYDLPVIIEDKPKLDARQVSELALILDECEDEYKAWVYAYVSKKFKTADLSGVTADMYERMKDAATKNMQKNYEKLSASSTLSAEELAEVAQ